MLEHKSSPHDAFWASHELGRSRGFKTILSHIVSVRARYTFSVQQSLHEMQLALRVLNAITNHRDPEPADVEELHRLAPSEQGISIDELACRVVTKALQRRAI